MVIPMKDKVVAGSSHGSTAKGLAINLQVTGSGPVNCSVSFPSSFFTMYSSPLCLSLVSHGMETISIRYIAVLCQQNILTSLPT